ncbi:MAG: hypothetical protein IJ341_06930 [Bacteroidales bacterium]|nr:hypothetical protein [Bacteroidales bacterium]
MNNETKIYLEKLIEAIDSPDWWIIVITLINAIIMLWLGWRQYKLQKQQTYLQEQQIQKQEFEIYSQLYKIVKKADVEIDYYLNEITDSLGVVPWKRADNGFLKRKLDYIEQLYRELEHNAIKFEIKFSKEFFDLKGYKDILSLMIYNLKSLVDLVEENKMIIIHTGSQKIYDVDGSIETGKAYFITQRITDKKLEIIIGSNLLHFIEQRSKLRENRNDILSKIRNRCKID